MTAVLNPPHLSWINIDARLCLSSTIKNIRLRQILVQQVYLLYMVQIFFFQHYLHDTTLIDRHLTTVCICDKESKQPGKVEVLPFLALCQFSGFCSKFWVLLLCLTAFASPHLSWINFDNDLCLRSTMRTMGCCLSYFNIVGAFFFQ